MKIKHFIMMTKLLMTKTDYNDDDEDYGNDVDGNNEDVILFNGESTKRKYTIYLSTVPLLCKWHELVLTNL